MFDIAWSEMAIIAAVALVVIGPKDLPRVLRTVGQWTGKARAMAREFQNSLEELARESELDSLKKDVENVVNVDIAAEIDPTGELKKSIEDVQSVATFDPTKDASAQPESVTSTGAESAKLLPDQAHEAVVEPLPKTGTGVSG
jgi:sec-independent protein translocase protein TatB